MTESLVAVGRVTRSHGIRGELRVLPYSDSVESLCGYDRLYFRTPDADDQIIEIISARPHKKNIVLLKLTGFHTRDSAETLVGAEVCVQQSWMPALDEDEYYWSDLIGMEVKDEQGSFLGKVKQIMTTASDDLLVIDHLNQEILIPFRQEIVTNVDIESGVIHLDLPPGLLDI